MSGLADDSTLWRGALAGDGDAFGELFDRHRDRVFRHAARQLVDKRDVEDVVAAAFFELWRRRGAVRMVDGSVLPWLLVTATNLARNAVRSVRRYRKLLDALPRDERLGGSVDAGLDACDGQRRVDAALRSLNRIDAVLVVLTVFEGYSIASAAETVGLAPGAARVRLHRAKQRLRAAPFARTIREGTA